MLILALLLAQATPLVSSGTNLGSNAPDAAAPTQQAANPVHACSMAPQTAGADIPPPHIVTTPAAAQVDGAPARQNLLLTPSSVPMLILMDGVRQPDGATTPAARGATVEADAVARDIIAQRIARDAVAQLLQRSPLTPDLLWRRGENPDERLYAPVLRPVGGCEISTPISGNLTPQIIAPARPEPAGAPPNRN